MGKLCIEHHRASIQCVAEADSDDKLFLPNQGICNAQNLGENTLPVGRDRVTRRRKQLKCDRLYYAPLHNKASDRGSVAIGARDVDLCKLRV